MTKIYGALSALLLIAVAPTALSQPNPTADLSSTQTPRAQALRALEARLAEQRGSAGLQSMEGAGSATVRGGPQIISVAPNATVQALVSMKELSRIAIEGGRIAHIDKRADAAEVMRDEKTGELRVLPNENDLRPINVIVTSDKGNTYTLILRVEDLPSQTILLRDSSVAKRVATTAAPMPAKLEGFERQLRQLIVALARDEKPVDAEVVHREQEFGLWQDTHFILKTALVVRSFVGERYWLTNTGNQVMSIAEQQFFKPGVLAVSVQFEQLPPGTRTEVYVVRERLPSE
jgi:conjugal transfer pilus assembly protein TraK